MPRGVPVDPIHQARPGAADPANTAFREGYTPEEIFVGGPPLSLKRYLGFSHAGHTNVLRQALFVIAVGWLPLLIFTGVNSIIAHDRSFITFLTDYGVHARSLIAAPCLVFAELFAARRLGSLAAHFRNTGLV